MSSGDFNATIMAQSVKLIYKLLFEYLIYIHITIENKVYEIIETGVQRPHCKHHTFSLIANPLISL